MKIRLLIGWFSGLLIFCYGSVGSAAIFNFDSVWLAGQAYSDADSPVSYPDYITIEGYAQGALVDTFIADLSDAVGDLKYFDVNMAGIDSLKFIPENGVLKWFYMDDFTYNGITLTFDDIPFSEPDSYGGLDSWINLVTTTYATYNGNYGNTLVPVSGEYFAYNQSAGTIRIGGYEPVPVPGSLILLSCGLLGFIGVRRRN